VNRGNIYKKIGDKKAVEKAVDDFNSAILLKPDAGYPYFQRGRFTWSEKNTKRRSRTLTP
jgi:hypothetical protein